MSDFVPVRRALVSVSDKTDLVALARRLAQHGVQIISTGGTAVAIGAAGLEVTPVEQVTDFPEMMDGRVKTLHPRIQRGDSVVLAVPGRRHTGMARKRGGGGNRKASIHWLRRGASLSGLLSGILRALAPWREDPNHGGLELDVAGRRRASWPRQSPRKCAARRCGSSSQELWWRPRRARRLRGSRPCRPRRSHADCPRPTRAPRTADQ